MSRPPRAFAKLSQEMFSLTTLVEECEHIRSLVPNFAGSNAGELSVVTENSVGSENTGVPIIREMMVATTMSSLFVALFALVASSFRTRDALQADILALRHRLHHLRKFGLGYKQPSLS